MAKFHTIILLLVTSFSLASCSSIPFLAQEKAAVLISSTPSATVYLNDTHIGQTPIDNRDIKPGEYVIKIEVENDPSKVWQSKINLSPQIVTVINKEFGDTPDQSSHYTLQLEPLDDKDASELSIITQPDQAVVKIDGQPEGFSPIIIRENISVGDHTISIIKPGYQEQIIAAQIQAGFKLVVSSQLAQSLALNDPIPASSSANTATDSASPADDQAIEDDTTDQDDLEESPEPTITPKADTSTNTSSSSSSSEVEILNTGTGWLRVRSEPTATLDNEVAKVDVGSTYPLIEENDTGWYLIEYEEGSQGWISGRYAEKL